MVQKKRSNSSSNRVVVAMSGGVDSSLVAAILKNEGRDIIGMTFRMWSKEECGAASGRACCSLEAVTRARAVAQRLDIPYYVVDLSSDFKNDVVDYFCEQYLNGLTPNPCVICNEKIKFGKLLDKALSLGASHIATGHYARISYDRARDRYCLLEGKDAPHEQSYFLFALSQDQLKRAVFPLGDFTKNQTRAMAKKLGIDSYDTASSQDVCFTQEMKYADYIQKKTGVSLAAGDIVDTQGRLVGKHKGIASYTIGQRRGLGIAHSQPLYVIAIDVRANRIVVGTKEYVLRKGLVAERVNWISVAGIDRPIKVKAKIRYNAKKATALVSDIGGGCVRVDFDQPQEAPTPGQAVVFYDKDVVVGGAWIREAF